MEFQQSVIMEIRDDNVFRVARHINNLELTYTHTGILLETVETVFPRRELFVPIKIKIQSSVMETLLVLSMVGFNRYSGKWVLRTLGESICSS